MTFRSHCLAAAALILLAGPGLAQDSTTPPPATTATPDATAPAAETPPAATTDAAPATPVKPAEQDKNFPVSDAEQPREMVRDTFDDWEVRCSTKEPDRCFLYQIVKDGEGRGLAEFTLIRLPSGGQAAAGATVVTSLGVLLSKGISLTIDTAQPLSYPYLYCAQSGCFARLGLTDATVTRMKKGNAAKFTLFGVNAPEKGVEGNLSLKGFTAAYDSLKALKK